MSHTSPYRQVLRVTCVFLILAFLVMQPPAASGAWNDASVKDPPPGDEPPVDLTINPDNQAVSPPIVEETSQPVFEGPFNPGDQVDPTTLGRYPVPLAPTPESPVGPVYYGPPPGSEGGVDNTQPEANPVILQSAGITPQPPIEEAPAPEEPAVDISQPGSGEGSLVPEQISPAAAELLVINGNLDDFDRPDGALGPGWTLRQGTISIVNQVAEQPVEEAHSLATHNGIGTNSLGSYVSIRPGAGSQYAALTLNYGAGNNYIFVKVQDNGSTGSFNTAACYSKNDGSSSFGLGFFNLDATFTSAHMQVAVDNNRTVTLVFSEINGGSSVQTYTCTGAPPIEGNQIGIGFYGGGRIDDLSVEPARALRYDHFGRPDGALGSNWVSRNGDILISNQGAAAKSAVTGLATLNGLGSNSVEADVSLKPGGGIQYSGFALNYGAGVSNVFVKVQDNDGNGNFEKGACYTGNNSGPFGLGYFDLAAPFTSAHMQVSVDAARNVSLILTKINGGTGSQAYTCAGAPPAEGEGVGIASWGGGRIDNFYSIQDFRDNFSRPDGPLGSDWTVLASSFAIAGGAAQGGDLALATYDGLGSNSIEGDVIINPAGGVQYSGFVLNYGAGVSNIFVKVQDNNSNGNFEKGACYTGNNNGFAPFGLGIFDLAAPFTHAHMQVSVDASRKVVIVLSQIDGGSGVQVYTCAGAPSAEGGAAGIASWGGGRIDNVVVNRLFAWDGFNRPDGAPGPNWSVRADNFNLAGQVIEGGEFPAGSHALATLNGVTGDTVEGDVSLKPGAGLQYSGFVLNYGAGVSNIFIKVQDSDGNGNFEKGACYTGNNSGPFGLGYFDLAAPFTSAHMQVSVDAARNVSLILTKINGGTGSQAYTCAGAPPREGNRVGIAGWGGGRIDNFTVNDFRFPSFLFLPVLLR